MARRGYQNSLYSAGCVHSGGALKERLEIFITIFPFAIDSTF